MKTSKNRKRYVKILGVAALAAALTVTQPFASRYSYAVVYEDCDLDGYDDATGAAMPWIGFDGTKGDTVPSDWDGKTIYGSKAEYKKAHESAASDSKTSSGGSSTNKKTTTTKNTGTSSKKTSGKKSSTSSKNTSSTSSKKKSSKKKSSKTDADSSEKKEEKTADSTDTETSKTDKDTSKKSKKKSKSGKAAKDKNTTDAESTEADATEQQDDVSTEEETDSEESGDTIAEGVLNIREADGSALHAGSQLVIEGTNFAENTDGLTVEIHSDTVLNLGTVASDQDGSFELQADIPADLQQGTHEVVVFYQGEKVASQNVEIGEKAADTFLAALTVGFSEGNHGLAAGLLILAGLAVVGVVLYLLSKVSAKKNVIQDLELK